MLPPLLCLLISGFALGRVESDETNEGYKNYKVALFTGSEKNVPFWELFADFMRAAGKDLGIELEVHYAEGSRTEMAAQILGVCTRSDKPDAIVVQGFKRGGLNSLQIAEENEVPVFLVNAGLTDKQTAESGRPGEKLKYWIGEMLPNDYDAGKLLANALIDEARKDPQRLGPDGRVHVIGLNGVVSDGASVQRESGLKDAIAERREEAELHQVISADWEQDLAERRCRFLHRRYPEATVIWCASDRMAAGAIDAVRKRGLTPGEDVIIGGVDATPDAKRLIEDGTLEATVGGHFMEGGWVTVLLYDYFHNPELIPIHLDSPMMLVTRKELDDYRAMINPSTWEQTDFRQFSRFHHPELKSYQFGLKALLTGKPNKTPSSSAQEEKDLKEDDRNTE